MNSNLKCRGPLFFIVLACFLYESICKAADPQATKTVIPFQKKYQDYYPEVGFGKRASLWVVTKEVNVEKIECENHYPFVDQEIKFESIQNCYDKEFGFAFLILGNALFNKSVPESYRRYLPKQCFEYKHLVQNKNSRHGVKK